MHLCVCAMNRYSNAFILFCACCSCVQTCWGQCGAVKSVFTCFSIIFLQLVWLALCCTVDVFYTAIAICLQVHVYKVKLSDEILIASCFEEIIFTLCMFQIHVIYLKIYIKIHFQFPGFQSQFNGSDCL